MVERHTDNMEDEVHRFTKNGDQNLKPGYFFQACGDEAACASLKKCVAPGKVSADASPVYALQAVV